MMENDLIFTLISLISSFELRKKVKSICSSLVRDAPDWKYSQILSNFFFLENMLSNIYQIFFSWKICQQRKKKCQILPNFLRILLSQMWTNTFDIETWKSGNECLNKDEQFSPNLEKFHRRLPSLNGHS